jgi:hypothetical protein
MKSFKTGIVVILLITGMIVAAFPPAPAVVESSSAIPGFIYLGRLFIGAAIILITSKNAFWFINS